jgi:hypothetical protein
MISLINRWEHSREGSGWVDDIQDHPRGRVGRAWRTRQDVRKFAAEQKLSESEALKIGMEQKAREFAETGNELYSKA